MRALTDAEAKVIGALLSASTERERERLRVLKVPRSTYHAARRRAYQEGWLRDRYVPDPTRFGWPRATFVIARPYADRAAALLTGWASEPGNVVTWGGAQMAFGVFFHSSEAESRAALARWSGQRWFGSSLSVSADLHLPSVPVYFDFEGLWAHLTAAPGSLSYPHGLAGVGTGPEDGSLWKRADPRQAWAAAELLHRPFIEGSESRAGHLMGPFGLPWSQQRLLALGWVTHRVLLDPSRIPSYQGRSPDQFVFLVGHLLSGARPESLFATLTRDCRVYPFLFVTEGRDVLIGALGRSSSPTAPRGAGSEPPRKPVMATLRESLEGIEVVEERAASVTLAVDHRYDRLLARKSPA